MTPAELRTLRESLNLTGEQLAQLFGVRDRTVRRWEAGEWTIPDDAADHLRRLDAQIERAVIEAVEAVERAPERPADAVLVRYRTDADLARYRPDMRSLPASVHGALVDRVRLAFSRLDIPTRIVWMDPDAYDRWRGRRRDTEPLRAQWAAEQIAPAPDA